MDKVKFDFRKVTPLELLELEKERVNYVSNFYCESPSTSPVINDLRFNYNYLNIGCFLIGELGKFQLEVDDVNKMVFILLIECPYKKRGDGTTMMNQLVEVLDKYGYGCKLEVSEKFGVPIESLVKFYERFGFKPYGKYFHGMFRRAKGEASNG